MSVSPKHNHSYGPSLVFTQNTNVKVFAQFHNKRIFNIIMVLIHPVRHRYPRTPRIYSGGAAPQTPRIPCGCAPQTPCTLGGCATQQVLILTMKLFRGVSPRIMPEIFRMQSSSTVGLGGSTSDIHRLPKRLQQQPLAWDLLAITEHCVLNAFLVTRFL